MHHLVVISSAIAAHEQGGNGRFWNVFAVSAGGLILPARRGWDTIGIVVVVVVVFFFSSRDAVTRSSREEHDTWVATLP